MESYSVHSALASFMQRNIEWIHPCCCMSQCFLSLLLDKIPLRTYHNSSSLLVMGTWVMSSWNIGWKYYNECLCPPLKEFSFFLTVVHVQALPQVPEQASPLWEVKPLGFPRPSIMGACFLGKSVSSRVGETTLLRLTPSLPASSPLAAGALSLPDRAGGLARGPP